MITEQDLRELGREITHRQVSSGSRDNYGTPSRSTTDQTVLARVDYRAQHTPGMDPQGADPEYDAAVYVLDSVSVEAPDDGPSDEFVLDTEGRTLTVVAVEYQDNGLKKCLCQA